MPGGFVEYGETVESAAMRETKEETGLDVDLIRLVGVYSNPRRDPRGHIVSVCFLCHKVGGTLRADTDAAEVKCFDFDKISTIELAFDHRIILEDAYKLIHENKHDF